MTKKLPLRNHRHTLDQVSQTIGRISQTVGRVSPNLGKLSPTVILIDNGKARCQYEATCLHAPVNGEAFCKEHMDKNKYPFKTILSGSEPPYTPDVWNADPFIQKVHNCFAYALNIVSNSLAEECRTKKECNTHQPGEHAKWLPMDEKTCPNLIGRILGDDAYIPIGYEEQCPKGTSMVAFIIDTKRDYHVLRLDNTHYFSHKGGQGPVTDKDAKGNRIADVRLANFDYSKKGDQLYYNHFCGYFCISRSKVHAAVSRGGFRKTRRVRHFRRLTRGSKTKLRRQRSGN